MRDLLSSRTSINGTVSKYKKMLLTFAPRGFKRYLQNFAQRPKLLSDYLPRPNSDYKPKLLGSCSAGPSVEPEIAFQAVNPPLRTDTDTKPASRSFAAA